MGIKDLHKFLRKHVPTIYKEYSLSNYWGKTIAIDTNLYLYKYKKIHKDNWLNMFVNLVMMLKKHNITCIFIYDTKAPIEKDFRKEERRERKKKAQKRIKDIKKALIEYNDNGSIDPLLEGIINKRKSKIKKLLNVKFETIMDKEAIDKELISLNNQVTSISRIEINQTKELLDIMSIPYYNSETEAETLCSYFCCHGLVDAVLSDDTDVLVYGTPIFLTKLNLQKETIIELKYNDIIDGLHLNHEQFTDLCIMCGTDYNRTIQNIAAERAYKLLNRYSNLDEITNERKDLDTSVLNFSRIRELFAVPKVIRAENYYFKNGEINMDRLKKFSVENNIKLNIIKN